MVSKVNWQDYIRPALEYDAQAFSVEDIESGLASGGYQLWETEGAAMITAGFLAKDSGLGVNVVATGGSFDAAMSLLDDVEVLARESGCKVIRFVGRPGWRKEAKRRNFSLVSTTYIKPLQP